MATSVRIEYSNLLEWLSDRRVIPSNWHVLLKSARSLTHQALKQTPSNIQKALIPDLTSHPYLPYHHVRNIYDSLTKNPPAELGARQRDENGIYKTDVHQAWAAAISAYEKEHLYLADCAQHLVRNTDERVAMLKRRIGRLEAEKSDVASRVATVTGEVSSAGKGLRERCVVYGVDENAKDLEKELREIVEKRIPEKVTQVLAKLKGEVKEAVEYYRGFSVFLGGKGEACGTVMRVMEGGVERGEILTEVALQQKYVNEMAEVQGFLEQRKKEIGARVELDVSLVLQQSKKLSEEVRRMKEEKISELIECVKSAVSDMTSGDMKTVLALQSEAIFQRVVMSITKKKEEIGRLKGMIEMLGKRAVEIEDENKQAQNKLEELNVETKNVRQRAEEVIETLIKGREVMIV